MDFAAIPPYVERLLTGGHEPDLPGLPASADRVVLILLDAFGSVFLERFGDHPLLRDITVCPLKSQFPSTTAAHITTIHTGLPVTEHGIYEWNVYEPSLDRVITPLRFSFAGDREGDTLLAAGVDPRDLVPARPCLYERLACTGVVSLVYQPDAFSPSTYDTAVIRAADIRPYRDLTDGLVDALRSVSALDRGYAYVYFHGIDLAGHVCGPSSDDFADAVRYALDAVEAALVRVDPSETLVLLTADHGQVDVDPEQVIWLDELHPPLRDLHQRPAGSSRDVFLHTDDVEETIAALSPHIETLATADMPEFAAAGPRLLERLAPVCVLPPPGRMAWLSTAADPSQHFRGHHGGRTPEEMSTYLAALRLP